jgi:predicted metal-binding membrane protein
MPAVSSIEAAWTVATPLKEDCLFNCQAPLTLVMRHGGFRSDPSGAVTLGLCHGLYCVGVVGR